MIREMKQKYIKTYIDVWIQEQHFLPVEDNKTMKLNSHYYNGDETKIH